MPIKPNNVLRPWLTQRIEPSQGRKVVNPFYQSKQWKKFRHAFITGFSTHLNTANPHPNSICIRCIKEGRITTTHTIDHIKPINRTDAYNTMNGLYGEPLTWENCQPLCESCAAVKNNEDKKLYR